MRRFLLFSALTAVCLGCNARDAGELSQDAGKLAKTATRSLTNASLAGKVNTVLSLRKGVDMSGWKVETEGSTVTLTGTVRNREEKKRILDTVEGIRGVEKIVDKLEVAR